MTAELKEIQSVLLGQTTLTGDGRITPVQKGSFHLLTGIGDGAAAVRFFGIAKRSRCFETELEPDAVNEAVRKHMQDMGRGVLLHRQPDTAACLIRYVLTRPAMMTFRYIDDVPTVTAWTGRGLFGWLSLRRALRTFEKSLCGEIVPSDRRPPQLPECAGQGKQSRQKKDRKEKNRTAWQAEAEQTVPDTQQSEQETPETPAGENGDVSDGMSAFHQDV